MSRVGEKQEHESFGILGFHRVNSCCACCL